MTGTADGDRELVLGRIRAALGTTPRPAELVREYRTAGEHPPGSAEALELLVDRLVDYRAVVLHRPQAVTAEAIGAAVAEAVSGITGLPRTARVLAPVGLEAGWLADLVAAGHAVLRDPAPAGAGAGAGEPLGVDALDRVDLVVTGCAVAIAETGTLVLDGTATSGRRAISLVPDRHLVVVRADQVVQTVPEGIARLRPVDAGSGLPAGAAGIRPLTLVSGPSATSDIELERVEGVHGPRTLVVVLTG